MKINGGIRDRGDGTFLKTEMFLLALFGESYTNWDHLNKRGIDGPTIYVFCKIVDENINHLFVNYLFCKTFGKRFLMGFIFMVYGIFHPYKRVFYKE